MPPKLTVLQDAAEVHAAFARSIADEIAMNTHRRRESTLILPVGPTAPYPLLAQICNNEQISWKGVRFALMDEYLDWTGRPLSPEHPLSFVGFMMRFISMLEPELRPHPDAWISPNPFDIDRVDRFLLEAGGADTCYGGIGVHGHLAFNEPPLSRFHDISDAEFINSPTRVVPLAPETVVMNATRAQGGRFSDFPPMAVTIGMRGIVGSHRIRLYCDGGIWQQHAIRRAVNGPAGVDYPVSLLRDHPAVEIFADVVSAAAIEERNLAGQDMS